jgi:hypothetical protein
VKKLTIRKFWIEKVMTVPILGMDCSAIIAVVGGNFGISRKLADKLSN